MASSEKRISACGHKGVRGARCVTVIKRLSPFFAHKKRFSLAQKLLLEYLDSFESVNIAFSDVNQFRSVVIYYFYTFSMQTFVLFNNLKYICKYLSAYLCFFVCCQGGKMPTKRWKTAQVKRFISTL